MRLNNMNRKILKNLADGYRPNFDREKSKMIPLEKNVGRKTLVVSWASKKNLKILKDNMLVDDNWNPS